MSKSPVRSCGLCQEFEDVLWAIESAELPEETRDLIEDFVQARYDEHRDQAGGASWEDV